ncbi:MAG: DUF4249 domain-containing protein [Prevotellaceae bacterium]|nr:DUF4249 domain-containing protein [Prevotellaceae bacterium]
MFQLFPVYFAVLFSACDSMMTYIDIESANTPPVLAVSSTINTDSSFYIAFTEARSIGSYRNWRAEEETIIRKGKITLYDETDDSLVIQEESDAFDMSFRSNASGYSNTYTHIPFQAGHTYRLTLDIEGYPVATSTAVMPEAPVIEQVSIDVNQTLHFSNAYQIESFNPNTFSVSPIDCHPLTLRLTDNSPQRDYYITYTKIMIARYFQTIDFDEIAISDRAVIQDNPDIEASQMFMDGEADAFVFDKMLFSDMSFANTTGTINLLINKDNIKQNDPKYPEPACDKEQRLLFTISLCVAHLTGDAYAHYRSIALQQAGVGFFSEPVSIISNIENGYGCFSAINTVQKKIVEYEICDFSNY